MKALVLLVTLSFISVSSFAQTSCEQDLFRSQLKVSRLQSENDRLRAELATYEHPTPVSRGFVCSAACTSPDGVPDMKYVELASAQLVSEAELLAKQATQKKYSCNFGVKKVECEKILTNNPEAKFCIAGCTSPDGKIDEKYLASAKGRTMVEAKTLALRATQEKYNCNFGTKIQACE